MAHSKVWESLSFYWLARKSESLPSLLFLGNAYCFPLRFIYTFCVYLRLPLSRSAHTLFDLKHLMATPPKAKPAPLRLK